MIQIIYIDLPYVDSDVPSWATSYESTPLSYIEIYIMVNNEKKKNEHNANGMGVDSAYTIKKRKTHKQKKFIWWKLHLKY